MAQSVSQMAERVERAWSRDHATSSVTAVLPPPGQRCGTVCLNSFGNRTSPSDNSNDRWNRLCLVSWAAVPCVWTLRALTRNLFTYLLTYLYIEPGNTVALRDELEPKCKFTKLKKCCCSCCCRRRGCCCWLLLLIPRYNQRHSKYLITQFDSGTTYERIGWYLRNLQYWLIYRKVK